MKRAEAAAIGGRVRRAHLGFGALTASRSSALSPNILGFCRELSWAAPLRRSDVDVTTIIILL